MTICSAISNHVTFCFFPCSQHLDREEADRLKALGRDTHVISIGTGGAAGHIDGSRHGIWTLEWYVCNCLVGAFVNSNFREVPAEQPDHTVSYSFPDAGTNFQFPYKDCPLITKRSFVVAGPRGVSLGGEALVNYGSSYNGRHLSNTGRDANTGSTV